MTSTSNGSNSTRKHYRVYSKKTQHQQKPSIRIVKNKKFALGLLGLAFVKGFFWGYLLKSRRR